MKRTIALVLSLVFLLSFNGCGKKDVVEQSEGLPENVNEIAADYDVVDDMPDWPGEKLELTVWYGYGQNETYIGKSAKDDKFRDEIERVTGVRISENNSFDNGGQSGDMKVAQMVATKSYPHIGMGLEASIADMFMEEGLLYDLEEYIPKYMPNYYKILQSDPEFQRQWKNTQSDKGTYALKRFHKRAFQFYDKDYTPEKYANLIQPRDSRNWIWVRDDILKQIYPEAKTQKEIQDIYMTNGAFTKEEMSDVVIKDMDDFRDLLEKINDLNITENGRKVWPFYTACGQDNYDLLSMFGTTLAGGGAGGDYVSEYVYYDGEKDTMVVTAEEEWFKDLCWYFTQLVIDGLASKEAIIDNKTQFDQKKANGEYAIFYGNMLPPTDEQLKAAGKNFSYRKVMLDIPCDYNKFVRKNDSKNVFDSYNMFFFKTLTPTQLEQTLRFIDFFYTEPGMKLANWGPKKAGLYEEDADGKMRYTDERFEAAKLYSGDKEVYVDYGIYSFPRIDYFMVPEGINKYQPELVYGEDAKRTASDWTKYWNFSYVEPEPDFPVTNFGWQIYSFGKYSDTVKGFWDARQASDDAMAKVFTAANKDEFEQLYAKMLETFRENGLNEQGVQEMNEVLKEKCGDTYEDLVNWTSDK